MDLFHKKLPHGQDELTAAQFSNRKITVQRPQVHCELTCVCAIAVTMSSNETSRSLLSEVSLMLRRHTKVFGLRLPIPYLSDARRGLLLKVPTLIPLFFLIPTTYLT